MGKYSVFRHGPHVKRCLPKIAKEEKVIRVDVGDDCYVLIIPPFEDEFYHYWFMKKNCRRAIHICGVGRQWSERERIQDALEQARYFMNDYLEEIGE